MSTIYLFMGKFYDYNPQFGVREDVNPKTWTNVTDIDDPDPLNSSEQYGAVGPIGVIGPIGATGPSDGGFFETHGYYQHERDNVDSLTLLSSSYVEYTVEEYTSPHT